MNRFSLFLLPIVALLGTTSSNAAQADSWTYVSESTDGTLYYVNTESIKKRYGMEVYIVKGGGSGNTREHTEAWWKIIYPDGSYTQTKSNFFCSLDISKDTSKVRYSAADTYTDSPRVDSFAFSTVPNTSFSKVFSFVCS